MDKVPTQTAYFANVKRYQDGDRVGQLVIMPYPKIQFEEVDHLDTSERGEGGFGSTGAACAIMVPMALWKR